MYRPWEGEGEKSQVNESDNEAFPGDANDEGIPENDNNDEDFENAGAGNGDIRRINTIHVHNYLCGKGYPSYAHSKNEKANFRRQCKPYALIDGGLYYVGKKKNLISAEKDLTTRRRVITSNRRRNELIKEIHEGLEEGAAAVSLSAHRGRDRAYELLRKRYYWPNMYEDVAYYCRVCDVCQKVNPAVLKIRDVLHNVAVPKRVMAQIGIDLCQLPPAQGKKYIVVAVDYFSKWVEARALPDKTAAEVATFIYEDIVCRHGCVETMISDQGSEFNNAVCKELLRITGCRHRLCRPYHPQANGMVERLNQTLKNALLKSIGEDTSSWPLALPGVLFAYRVAVQRSTKFSPFYLMYKRDPLLPIDMNVEDSDSEEKVMHEGNCEEDFDEEEFYNVLHDILKMKNVVEDAVMDNIKKAQEEQKAQYNKKHLTGLDCYVGQMVLLANTRRQQRKGGKLDQFPRTGPYKIVELREPKGAVLQNLKGLVLKQVMPYSRLYPYFTDDKKDHDTSDSEKSDKDKQKAGHDTSSDDESDKDIGKGKGNSGFVPDKSDSEKENSDDDKSIDLGPQPHDDDVSDKGSIKPDDHYYFHPPTFEWRRELCNMIGIRRCLHEEESIPGPKPLAGTSSTEKIIGDGNCFYRALSFTLSGEQVSHCNIRRKLAAFMQTEPKVAKYSNASSSAAYVRQSGVGILGTWATDVEIFAAAIWLGIDIYVELNNEWQRFSHTGDLTGDLSERGLYLKNTGAVHYDVVIDIQNDEDEFFSMV